MMPTIENGGVTFTFKEGNVSDVDIEKKGNLDENAMPASDSDNAFILDFNGVIKTLTLTGELTPSTTSRTDSGSVKTIEEQTDWLMDLVDGSQSGYTFNSTYQTNKTLYCRRFKFKEKAGTPGGVTFTLEFVEGI